MQALRARPLQAGAALFAAWCVSIPVFAQSSGPIQDISGQLVAATIDFTTPTAGNTNDQIGDQSAAEPKAPELTPPVLVPPGVVTPGAGRSAEVTAPDPVRTVISDQTWNGTGIDVSQPRGRFPARLVNLSVRATISRTAPPIVAGAAILGSGDLPVLVRAIGPGLRPFGIANTAQRPVLALYAGQQSLAETNTLGLSTPAVAAYVGAFPAEPGSSGLATGDAALAGKPGEGTLTAHCTSAADTPGTAMLEFYDGDAAASATSARFVNFSAQAKLQPGDAPVIVGFSVAGDGNVRLLLRGVGASLRQFGVPGTLPDPQIELYAGGTRLAANDNAGSAAHSPAELEAATRECGAFPLDSSADSALIVTVPAGTYTLHVRGAAGLGGLALAEIYALTPAAAYDAARATNTFGLNLYRALASDSATNLIVSPYSIESSLALAYAGAGGATRAQMSAALALPTDNATLQAGFAVLRNALATAVRRSADEAAQRARTGGRFDAIDWNLANRVFAQEGFGVREAYLAYVRDAFDAPAELLSFRLNPEPSRLRINGWVEEQTRNRILDLLPPGSVTTDTRLVLVNALYLKAPWSTPFEAGATTLEPFQLTPQLEALVPTLRGTYEMGLLEDDGLTVVSLPYLGGSLQFLVVLPGAADSLSSAAARLTADHFARWARLPSRRVDLHLPKFRVEGASLALGVALRSLGMTAAFDGASADLSGIAPGLSIADVYHKIFVAVDEQGTEAAAATGVVVGITSLPPPPTEVRINRPFLFAIQERETGLCLFVGRVEDPR